MTRIIIINVLFFCCHVAFGQVIGNPKVDRQTENAVNIMSVETTDKETLVSFRYTNPFSQERRVWIDLNTFYIRADGIKYKLLRTEHVSNNQYDPTPVKPKGIIEFTATFQKVPAGTKMLDIIENATSSEVWSFYGVHVQTKEQELGTLKTKAGQENAHAQLQLGLKYLKGEDVEKNILLAVDWIEKSALQNNDSAQFYMGWIYHEGIQRDKDEQKSFEWYVKSATNGNAKGQYILGVYYEYGINVEINKAIAQEWYRKAVKQGVREAGEALTRLSPSEFQSDPNYPVLPEIIQFSLSKQTKILYVNKWNVGNFSDGLVAVYNGDKRKWGFADTEGNLVIDYKYGNSKWDTGLKFTDGVCALPNPDGEGSVLIDTKGETIASLTKCSGISNFRSGAALAVQYESEYDRVGKVIFINTKGEQIFPKLVFSLQWALHNKGNIRPVCDGLRAFFDFSNDKSLWGFIDLSGNIVIPAQFSEVEDFSEGLALVKVNETPGNWGYIDKTGKMVIEPKYHFKPMSFSHSYAVAFKRDGTKCIIDKTGNAVFEGFVDMKQFYKGYAFISYKFDGTSQENYLIDTNFNKDRKVPYYPSTGYDYSKGKEAYDNSPIEFVDDITMINKSTIGGKLIDYKGNIISKQDIGLFYNERAYCEKEFDINGKDEKISGFINTKGEYVFIFKDTTF